jgi:hypothetical protein
MNGRLDEVAIYDNAVSPKTAADQPASVLSLGPLASSLLGTGQQPTPAVPAPGPGNPSAPPASPSGGLPALDASSPAPARTTDAANAAAHAAAGADGAWLLTPFSPNSLDAI